jgi:DNA-binding NarL/FixJ family response regulator
MKILIADDHRLIVEAVAEKLAELAPGTVVVSAFSVDEMLAALDAGVTLALIDLGMPGAHGVSHVAEAHRRWPKLKIMVLSGAQDAAVIRAAMEAGASGFVPKAHSPEDMLTAVQTVLAGGVYLPPAMGLALPAETGADAALDPYAVSLAPSEARMRSMLTDRQRDVLQCLSAGLPNKEIARSLGISEGTVKIHLAAIFRALRARNRTEAVIAARALGGALNFKEKQPIAQT